jgi:hypothetical protein
MAGTILGQLAHTRKTECQRAARRGVSRRIDDMKNVRKARAGCERDRSTIVVGRLP